MKIIVSIILFFGGIITLFAQVPTQMFEKGKAFEKHPNFKIISQNSPVKKIPIFDLGPLLTEDAATKNSDLPFRFGKAIDVDLTLEDGKWQKMDSTEVWSLKIISPLAYSLNFIFSVLSLPEGAELFIYNEDGTMVYGPVSKDQNRSGKIFLSDIVQGESAIIQLSVPINQNKKPELTINKVIHGYKNLFSSNKTGYGESGGCTEDVACYQAWNDESDGVVQILLSSGDEICSGALLNNTAQDYKPYVLTAFHCIDIGAPFHEFFEQDNILQDVEINQAENWLVRFRFRHATCGGSTFANVITYNGNEFRSASVNTDFALVELEADIINDIYSVGYKVWLGWDRSGNIPTNGTCIHHPSGDVAKISFEDNSLTETSYKQSSGTSHWRVYRWDNGVTETASSGAPLFDQNKRVVGQLHGGGSSCSQPNSPDWFGCFYRSWTGDSTNTTRLSNWLQPAGAPIAPTLNSVRQPMPQYSGGTDLLCIGSTSSFSITNLAPGYSLHHWNGGNVTFPNGNTSNPVLVSGSSQGQGWVQAVINTGAGQYTVAAKTFWVGIPTVNSITGTSPIGVYQPATYYAELSSFNSLPDSYYWATSPSTGVTITSNGHYASIMFTQPGWYQVVAKAHNACGWSSYAMKMVNVISGYSMAISPNPATGETTVELVNDNKEALAALTEWDYEIYDSMQGLKEKKTKLKGTQAKINTSGWNDGIYIIRAKIGDEVITEKLVVKH